MDGHLASLDQECPGPPENNRGSSKRRWDEPRPRPGSPEHRLVDLSLSFQYFSPLEHKDWRADQQHPQGRDRRILQGNPMAGEAEEETHWSNVLMYFKFKSPCADHKQWRSSSLQSVQLEQAPSASRSYSPCLQCPCQEFWHVSVGISIMLP